MIEPMDRSGRVRVILTVLAKGMGTSMGFPRDLDLDLGFGPGWLMEWDYL